MRRFLFLICLCVFINPGIANTQEPDTNWVLQTAVTSDNLHSITFVDDDTGWIAGEHTLLFTDDQGLHWTKIDSTVSDNHTCQDITVLDYNHIWRIMQFDTVLDTIVANLSMIHFSADGGNSWEVMYVNDSVLLTSIHFIDSLHGIATGSQGVLLITSDGGVNWQLQGLYQELLRNVYFLDTTLGWIAGDKSMILKTMDQGANWEPHYLDEYVSLSAIFFTDAQNGWAGGNLGRLFHTSDGGTSWVLHQFESYDYFYDVYFKNPSAGWACSANGRLHYTGNGGVTWGLTELEEVNLRDMCFVNDTLGWIVGGLGSVYKTTNGGGKVNIDEHNPIAVFDNALIFPNPFTSKLSCRVHLNQGAMITFSIFDLSGKLLKTTNRFSERGTKTLDISDVIALLTPGYYLLDVSDSKSSRSFPLIKTRE